ncbi:MAG: deoxyribodipyrimidine photo-lyase [Saprospiraceae bacterium]
MSVCIFWFRRDLRLTDNAGLYHALTSGYKVVLVFIFDTHILDRLEDRNDARVTYIYDVISELKQGLSLLGSDLHVFHGSPENVWPGIVKQFNPKKIIFNHDYESYAQKRDNLLTNSWKSEGISVESFKDHVIFEKQEVVKDDGKPYTVFTPYKRKWLSKLASDDADPTDSFYLRSYPCDKYYHQFEKFGKPSTMISLKDMGFERTQKVIPPLSVPQTIIRHYEERRNFPAIEGTSRLGVHFRFGTISIRQKAQAAITISPSYLSELIWRDFYSQILYHFPHVEQRSFRSEYDRLEWRNDADEFDAWCQGMTGYPIVDAGMRELKMTGHMHNRVRMITASFLTKHLLIDWRWGEAWFARHLLDFDLASNNGGWQWAAGSGTDAAPYFRIFSPDAQTDRFDKDRKYIKRWVPEFGTPAYPDPIIDHKLARERCLATYKMALRQV